MADEPIDFNREIRPLLSRHCIACHGPDEEDRQAGLRLDTFEGATDYSIAPGDADGSDFIDRITTDDEDLRMPPADHADALKAGEVELLKKWIDQGAMYDTHWAFTPIAEPEVPSATRNSDGEARVANAIDNFILAKLSKAGLKQSPRAEPRRLIRRLSLDLTGLPPVAHSRAVQDSIANYLGQPSQQAFEVVVDQLLDTPAYAEHSASVWLDLARYADTCGYAGDERRDIWPWRDWLIEAIANKKSYKEMSIEMLAGDMLPGATVDQKLATAFHRNTLSNNEGGTDDEEFRTIAIKDRLSTTLNAWMGLTVRCAECHSHKYDPISQQEYYQLLAFFNQTVDSDHRDDRPKLEVQAKVDPVKQAKTQAEIDALRSAIEGTPEVWTVAKPVELTSRSGTKFKQQVDGAILPFGPNPEREEYRFKFQLAAGTTVRSLRLEAIPHISFNGNVGRANEGAFILSQIRLAKQDVAEDGAEVVLPFAKAANDFNQVNRHASTAIKVKVESGGNHGWAVNHPQSGYKEHHEAIFELQSPLVADAKTEVTVYLLFDPPWVRLNMGCLRISFTDQADAVARYDKRELDQKRRELDLLEAKASSPIRVPVLEQLPKKRQRKTFVNLRGNFRSHGEEVSAQFPESFPPAAKDQRLDRLGLATWLFDETNPLTARVAVNRYWSRLMGIGLVETEEDFGTQGTPPSHPQLLDFLACQFRENQWDVRKLQKQIVMSATYQQSQNVNEKLLSADPRNRLLGRGPRVRLAAEVVRDQALAVTGLLSKKMYGPPVYPPSPVKGVVNAFTGGTKWQESRGEDRYRRAIYTFYKRSSPHPLFETFDIGSRDVCSMRRLRTNTPLQSFMTLNDITFIEAARSLATKMLDSTAIKGSDDQQDLRSQVRAGIEAALFVPADVHQVEVLVELYETAAEQYRANVKSAAEMIGERLKGDVASLKPNEKDRMVRHAAMTVVANAILNLDSFLNN